MLRVSFVHIGDDTDWLDDVLAWLCSHGLFDVHLWHDSTWRIPVCLRPVSLGFFLAGT